MLARRRTLTRQLEGALEDSDAHEISKVSALPGHAPGTDALSQANPCPAHTVFPITRPRIAANARTLCCRLHADAFLTLSSVSKLRPASALE